MRILESAHQIKQRTHIPTYNGLGRKIYYSSVKHKRDKSEIHGCGIPSLFIIILVFPHSSNRFGSVGPSSVLSKLLINVIEITVYCSVFLFDSPNIYLSVYYHHVYVRIF